MTEFKLEQKKLKITSEGKEYFMKYPSVSQMKSYHKKMKETDPAEAFEIIEGYFAELGLDPEVTARMDADSYLDVLGVLHGSKKN